MFVDIHSHAVPSGDDGAQTHADGLALCRVARQHGTAILFATPHVWGHLPLTDDREARIRTAYARLRAEVPLDLRLGFEVTPTRKVLRENLRRYALEGTDALLIDTPFVGPIDLLFRLAERALAQGLRPIAAHPERVEAVLSRPELMRELAEASLLVQINATSITGAHGPEIEELAWHALGAGLADIVASDGHRLSRPARLDAAWELVRPRLGGDAIRLFDGSALGVASRALAAEPGSRIGV